MVLYITLSEKSMSCNQLRKTINIFDDTSINDIKQKHKVKKQVKKRVHNRMVRKGCRSTKRKGRQVINKCNKQQKKIVNYFEHIHNIGTKELNNKLDKDVKEDTKESNSETQTINVVYKYVENNILNFDDDLGKDGIFPSCFINLHPHDKRVLHVIKNLEHSMVKGKVKFCSNIEERYRYRGD